MSVINSENKAHAATCVASEMTRQGAVAAAIVAGGGSPTVASAVRTAEVAHYRRLGASCLANGLQSAQFGQALSDLGTPGSKSRPIATT
jgi:hypothetical protein